MKHLEVLRAELERLFDLEELTSLSRDVLGFDPEIVGGRATLGSFAGALIAHCQHEDAVDALADALRSTGRELSPAALQISSPEPVADANLNAGTELGPYRIARKLGDGRLGSTYLAKQDGVDVRLKVLHPESSRDRRGLARYLVATRLAARLRAPGLPAFVSAGNVPSSAGEPRVVVAHEYVDGQPLSARVARTGPLHMNEARGLLQQMAETLALLHDKKLVHGSVSLENALVSRNANGENTIQLLDVGTDRLRVRQSRYRIGLSSTGGNPKTVSPEQVRGADADAKADIYSLGATMYELLTGKPPFEGDVLEMAFAHLSRQPAAPSAIAPRGWVTADVDALVLRLLAKNPAERGTMRDVVAALDEVGRPRRADALSEAQIEELEQRLLGEPGDAEVALQLESTVDRGATADRVGQAFRLAASMIDDPILLEQKVSLLQRAARLFESKAAHLDKAEKTYEDLLALQPHSEVASAGLEDVRRRAGKHDELIEMLLARAESAVQPAQRARAMAEIGRIYLRDLNDSEQATVAFAQALCDDPTEEYAGDVERAAGSSEQRWAEVLATVGEATQSPALSVEGRTRLFVHAGDWYRTKVSRADLALPCFQAALAAEPANETALHGLTEIYRKAQQWPELGATLTHRADAAATPTQARNLRSEAAEILETKIGDLGGARTIYEMVLSEDPSHERAGEALQRILERSGDFAALVVLLEARLAAQPRSEAVRTLCRIGEVESDRLGHPDAAVARYRRALEIDATNLDALRGLERLYTKQGKYRELIENLERQVEVAATPKQRITLLERIASVFEEEFLDQKAAARALERALELDASRVSAMAGLIRHLRVLERWDEVSKLYERQLSIVENPTERVALALAWGRVLAEQLGFPDRAVKAYELALEVEPDHSAALEALAKLQETTGDADRALDAILAIADQAETPQARAEQYVRAAKLLEARGNRDLAIEHYRNALDANPEDRAVASALRQAYVKRGDVNAAVELLERELEITEGDRPQARLAGELARLQRERLKDDRRAEQSAERALRLDASNLDALYVLGEICFKERRFVEASAHYARIGDRIESLGTDIAVGVLERYVDAMSQSGSSAGALAAVDTLLRLAPDDAEALSRVAQVTFEHGSPERAAEMLENYLSRFAASLSDEQKAVATYRYGEALRKTGNTRGALAKLEEAAELDPSNPAPLVALAAAYVELDDSAQALRVKTRHLDLARGEERIQLLTDIGDLASKLGDRTQATRSYVAALEERPDDRRLLTKLMQLYSEDKDWNKLVDVVVKLAEFVDEPAQKVKYLQTAALVSGRQIGDARQAAGFFAQVLEIDPNNDKALHELTDMERQTGNWAGVEDLLRRQLSRVPQSETARRLALYDQLASLYEKQLVAPRSAAEMLEAAFELDRDDKDRIERLAAIYASDPETFREKGIALQEYLLSQNPFRQDAYKALRKIYTVARDADASWSLCQVLSVLGLAEPDEERFYGRMRAETAAPAQEVFSEEDWRIRIAHPTLNPLLTSVFTLIEPVVVAARALPIEQLGLSEQHRIEPSQHEAPLSQTLYYAAGVLGVPLPRVYLNSNDPGGLGFLFTAQPSLSMGRVGLSSEVPPQVAAFVAARQLSYLRPGLYLRHFIQTGTALKAWLFAAIKLSSPQFPVAADIEGAVNEALAALKQYLPSDLRDHLASVVSKLIQSGTALDLKKWVAAVDLTADRAGFVVAHDLDTASQVIRASDDSTAAVPTQERFKELVVFAASSNYFTLRRHLQITVDS
ncbi:MAG TPA: protein kinase [Polyangiaceae bacterium]|nr:protein kinase [Polyangiaceae bacterium]